MQTFTHYSARYDAFLITPFLKASSPVANRQGNEWEKNLCLPIYLLGFR